MRTVEFKMERPGLVSPGDKVKSLNAREPAATAILLILLSPCPAVFPPGTGLNPNTVL